ncbi:MAG: penicillin-binding protein 2 [Nocardioides sp.]
MNKPIRTISIFCLLLFLALMINATYLQYVTAGELDKNPRNRRIIEAAFSRERGAILVGREPIAQSVPSDDRYDFQREYPQPFKYAPLTGAFSYFSQTGIERSQNAVLSGDDDRLFVTRLVDLVGNASPKGGSVQLTIDPAAQTAAWDGLESLGEGVEGAVVALEPSTGKILAMVSSPSYDPNKLASHDLDAVISEQQRLEGDAAEPLLNRTIQTTLPPGSTFKLVTAAAVLEDGNYAGGDALVPGGASYQLPQTSDENGLIDNGGRDCGTKKIPLTQALANSCNTSFLALADELGIEKIKAQAEAFGFNSDYLEDLPLQAQSRYPGDLDQPQTAMSGIGQSEVAATPLQMAMVGAGIANGGIVMRPYVVDEVTSPELDVLDKTEPSDLSKAMEPANAAELTRMMVATVQTGTATSAQIPGIEVAGKTGTAQSTPDRPPYAWFVSFAPAIDPKVAVCVLIQASSTPREEIGGNFLGAPIARSVMEAVLR